MRQLKFRAWLPNHKKMYSVISFSGKFTGEDFYRVFINKAYVKGEPANFRCGKDNPLMQFTGLLDKNSNEIYEGDIVKLYANAYGSDMRWKLAVVEYYHSFFGFRNVKWFLDEGLTREVQIPQLGQARLRNIPSDIWLSDLKECFVIGNIYENPELLPK